MKACQRKIWKNVFKWLSDGVRKTDARVIAEKITEENPVWDGSISDFRDFLGTDITPIQLGMKLNVTAGRLLNEYGILYESRRTHAGRRIKFVLQA